MDRLMSLAGTAPMPQVRAEAQYELEQLAVQLAQATDGAQPEDRAHYRLLTSEIGRFLTGRTRRSPSRAPRHAARRPDRASPRMRWLGAVGAPAAATSGHAPGRPELRLGPVVVVAPRGPPHTGTQGSRGAGAGPKLRVERGPGGSAPLPRPRPRVALLPDVRSVQIYIPSQPTGGLGRPRGSIRAPGAEHEADHHRGSQEEHGRAAEPRGLRRRALRRDASWEAARRHRPRRGRHAPGAAARPPREA